MRRSFRGIAEANLFLPRDSKHASMSSSIRFTIGNLEGNDFHRYSSYQALRREIVDGGRNQVTIADVARLAGVSQGPASKALNGRGSISPDTVRRVREAADKLGYQANTLARGLLAGRTWTVGLITTDSFGRFSIPVMQGAEDALGPGSMAVFLCDGRGDRIREQHYLRSLLERRVDG